MKTRSVLKTMEGLDASRRAGWAKFFTAEEELQEMREVLHALAELVIYHPRIHSQDEIIELARRALRT